MKNLLSFLLLSSLLISCSSDSPKQIVTNPVDYNHLMQAKAVNASLDIEDSEIAFWTDKVRKSPQSFMFLNRLAGAYAQGFKNTGNISFLHRSDSLYKKALELTPFSKASIYRALSANAITQHEFPMAKYYAEKAIEDGSKLSASYYFLFDALIELGDYESARHILSKQASQNTFDYLTRASKLADHDGDLDQAITLMEQAYERTRNNKNMFSWTKSNLGDMYGHAGRIQESYNTYLEVLEKDPEHWHSWQGIAWITFAHDKDTEAAKNILNYIKTRNQSPDTDLMLAEIADYEGHEKQSEQLKESYYRKVSGGEYSGMYNKYLILLESEDFNMTAKALERAMAEVDKRPTPVVYDLLAWSLFQNGEYEKALRIATLFVEGQTFEPDAMYHLGMIYRYNNHEKQARKYLKEALDSSFELGPLTTAAIEEALEG